MEKNKVLIVYECDYEVIKNELDNIKNILSEDFGIEDNEVILFSAYTGTDKKLTDETSNELTKVLRTLTSDDCILLYGYTDPIFGYGNTDDIDDLNEHLNMSYRYGRRHYIEIIAYDEYNDTFETVG